MTEAFAVDDVDGLHRQAIETDPVAFFLDKIAGEQIGRQVAEDVFLLQFDDHGAPAPSGDFVVEGLEFRVQQCSDVDVKADVARYGNAVGLGQHGKHALIERRRQVLEQPPVG